MLLLVRKCLTASDAEPVLSWNGETFTFPASDMARAARLARTFAKHNADEQYGVMRADGTIEWA